MKSVIGPILGLLILAALAAGQSNEEKYKKKLEKEFVSRVEWVQSLDKAKEAAAKGSKLIFGYFTRSYSP